ncbi:MAG: M23 family metallopeptidase [Candidatus Aegiribacteria sp.]|nr:M23 family metallopeptidase [Candidatus Aegiribacteria sp.]
MTKRHKSNKISHIAGFVLPVLFLFSISCRDRLEEGEIIIRAIDVLPKHIVSTELPGSDSSSISTDQISVVVTDPSVDTIISPDSLAALPDSLMPDTLEIPRVDSIVPEYQWNRLAVEINGSIYASLQDEVEDPDILGAHIVRCMWWDTDPWRGMNAGDSLYVLFGATGRENQVVALSYVPKEGTANNPLSVYSFQMTGDNWPSHYYADGTEVMRFLNYMPITTFEEMTGPYGEPRGNHSHAGVDYKAPEGTSIRTCRGGTVSRINWNCEYNGNCVEISIGSGYSEVFLHLKAVADSVVAGVTLQKGDTVGYVGTTGRTSTSPHLHYQINDENGNPIDPYLFYGSHRRNLPRPDMDAFIQFRNICDSQLRGATLGVTE